MIIDMTHTKVEDGERTYIKQEGAITLKVVKVTESTTQNNNPQIKVHFQDKIGRFAIADFVVTDNALWALKIFTKALKMPNIIDTNLMVDRYVIAHFKARKTANGEIFEIKKYEPSQLTNTLEQKDVIPTVHETVQQEASTYPPLRKEMPASNEVPAIDVDEDTIPF